MKRGEGAEGGFGRARRAFTGVLVVAAAAAVLAVPADAARRATIGSDLQPAPDTGSGFGCGDTQPCTVQQLAIPGNPFRMKAPFRGVIRKWRFRKDSTQTFPVRLRVVRRADGGRWRFVRTSAYGTLPPTSGTFVFPVRLRVRKGDRIAVDLPATPGDPWTGFSVDDPDALYLSYFPAPANGALANPFVDDEGPNGDEYLWNATIRRTPLRKRR